MRGNYLNKFLGISLLVAIGFASCKKSETLVNQNVTRNEVAVKTETFNNSVPIPGQYIVVYKPAYVSRIMPVFKQAPTYNQKEQLMAAINSNFVSQMNIPASAIQFNYHSSIIGFSAALSDYEVAALRQNQDIEYIEHDQTISLGSTSATTATVSPLWDISRVGGGSSAYTGSNVAWIIDTGIDSLHPEIKGHVGYVGSAWKGISFITKGANSKSSFDQNGHGTHVSGTISAVGIKMIGVAPGAMVIPVRVLDASGSGTNSGVIKGIDYVGANASNGDVANMSLGGSYSKALNDAVISASGNSTKHCFFAIAAGNSSASYLNYSPASAAGPYIYTVTAMDNNDKWASFSNYGDAQTGGNVLYCEPGVSIYSSYAGTLKGGKYSGGSYATLSGTSMATPHLAGVMLVVGSSITTNGSVSSDPDGNADPIGHE
jgi:subtilisin family serine protease